MEIARWMWLEMKFQLRHGWRLTVWPPTSRYCTTTPTGLHLILHPRQSPGYHCLQIPPISCRNLAYPWQPGLILTPGRRLWNWKALVSSCISNSVDWQTRCFLSSIRLRCTFLSFFVPFFPASTALPMSAGEAFLGVLAYPSLCALLSLGFAWCLEGTLYKLVTKVPLRMSSLSSSWSYKPDSLGNK